MKFNKYKVFEKELEPFLNTKYHLGDLVQIIAIYAHEDAGFVNVVVYE